MEDIQIQLISIKDIREHINISLAQSNEIERVLDRYQKETNSIAKTWRDSNPEKKYQILNLNHFIEQIERSFAAIDNLMDQTQKRNLKQLAYQQMGWNTVFQLWSASVRRL